MATSNKGLEQFHQQLQALARKAEAVGGKYEIPLLELFSDEFMQLHTDYDSLEAMLEASGFIVNSREDCQAIPSDQWDVFVANRTRFSDWQEMMQVAREEYIAKTLGFGL